jgi:hypothetical protein
VQVTELTKPLSETHPTLWNWVEVSGQDEKAVLAGYIRVPCDTIQSFTIDVKEHKRILVKMMADTEKFTKGFTLLRVKEAIKKQNFCDGDCCINKHEVLLLNELGLEDETREE